ncbi:MAG TPA: glycine cleavage T C-terminal barrel domain-containing protein [Thermoplasmata archaeon]|nr:glycine cleavage T C-terminal barrel domain-containing protein [Thermoplasmata archaeon]
MGPLRLSLITGCRTAATESFMQASAIAARLPRAQGSETFMAAKKRIRKTTAPKRSPSRKRPYDMALIQRGARLRRSPFFDKTLEAGCRAYTVYNHTFLPSYYDDPVNEYWHLLKHVALWDVAVERNVEISGPDGFAFMQLLTPRDMSKCRVGQGKYVLITDEDGGILNDPVLLRLEENRFWIALADSDILLWAKGVAQHAGMKVTIREPDASPLQVQGPKSKELMADLFGEKVTTLPYYFFTRTDLDGIPLLVTRTGWTGEVGYELYLLDASRGGQLWDAVVKAGKKYNLRPTGPSDIRRIEAGILNYGADMMIENNPYEVGLGWTVDLDKPGDFVGKAALQRIKDEGPKWKLVGVEIDGKPIGFNMTKWTVSAGGRPVGRVTSAIHSPRLRANIGYAMLPIVHADMGTELTVEHPDGRRHATVVKKPFLDPGKEIPKA